MIDNILNLWNLGGIMMYPLFIAAFIGFVIFLERILYMRKENIRTVEFLTGIKSKLSKGNELEALTIAESTPGAVARLSKEIILSFADTVSVMRADRIEVVKQAATTKALLEISLLNKNIYILGLIARICPILGLLGTLIAIFDGYNTMLEAGPYASIVLFSSQVYNAIITSIFGLAFFFIFLIFHSILKHKMRSALRDMQWAINDLIVFMLRTMPQDENIYNQGENLYNQSAKLSNQAENLYNQGDE